MSHFGRAGPPDIRDTYSLLVLNITFRTTADDLFPLFDKYGKVVDVFIPRDRRSGDSRGFAFVRYKYADEAQKAVEKLDGRVVDGREIMVQFAKYGPNAERIHKGKIMEPLEKIKGRSRSRSPRPSTFISTQALPQTGWGRLHESFFSIRMVLHILKSFAGIGKDTGTRITGGEVAVEVGEDLTETGIAEGTEIIVIEVGVVVEVLAIAKNVGEPRMRGAVAVGPMEGVALVPEEAYPHVGHLLQEVEVLLETVTRKAPPFREVFLPVAELLILEHHLHVTLMLKNE